MRAVVAVVLALVFIVLTCDAARIPPRIRSFSPASLQPLTSISRPCTPPNNTFPFCDTSLSHAERVADLISRLTLDEKACQMVNQACSIPRLGLPLYDWWSEALHGVLSSCDSTTGRCPSSFPAAITTASSFNVTLFKDVADAISDEARVLHFAGALTGDKTPYSLDVWMPNINIFRDPRWGRGQETPGEDPFLSGVYGSNIVYHMEGAGKDPNYLKLAATMKHFDAYSLEDWKGMDRLHFNAIVTAQDLNQTYFPAFEATVRSGHVHGVMCSYNEVNGVPSCVNSFLQDVVRDTWGFDGYITSDCGAIDDITKTHNYTTSGANASALAVTAGTDLDCGGIYTNGLVDAVEAGYFKEDHMDVSLTRLYGLQMKLGWYDPLDNQTYAKIPADVVDSAKHRELAAEAAREGIVLLKNDKNLLPLSTSTPLNVAVIGPHANSTDALCSNYHGTLPSVTSPLAALSKMSQLKITYAPGCEILGNDTSGYDKAVSAAAAADVALVFMGINQTVEAEGHDRETISLPEIQQNLLQKIYAVQTRTVLVLINGGPVAIDWAAENIPSIVEAYYPGEEGGTAIADILFGAYNPSGRLVVTMYPSNFVDQIPMTDMNMRHSPGRTYRFYTGTPLFEFGHGLSYTTFSYQINGPDNAVVGPTDLVEYSISVTNTGKVAGSSAVLAFLKAPSTPSQDCPLKQLFGFNKTSILAPGAGESFTFTPTGLAAMCANTEGHRVVWSGEYTIQVGDATARFTVRARKGETQSTYVM